jgi:hypothetical protein
MVVTSVGSIALASVQQRIVENEPTKGKSPAMTSASNDSFTGMPQRNPCAKRPLEHRRLKNLDEMKVRAP